ncbi:Tryptophan--tRNA ligase, mitochondrial [Ceratobasidium sp. 414]|nr:Tryptophan--tRNA ligase, mitochondrial [Ceratobasidium sp. 414]
MQAQLRIASRIRTHSSHLAPSATSTLHEALRYTSGGQISPPKTIFSGIQPTGIPHTDPAMCQLGNYLGALVNWVSLQRNAVPNDRLYFSIVGLHALTLPQDPVKLRRERLDLLATLLAVGLDPRRSVLFCQDQASELAWMLNCITPMGKLQRMTTWKSKLALARNANSADEVDESHLNLGLFAYPVLQAADILLYRATHVPVGEDQQQHLELSRDLADVFNRTYKEAVFPLPQHIITPAKRILSLRDPTQKMSKSAPHPSSRILLTDPAEVIEKKVRSAVTDSERGVTYDPTARPGVSNLLTILDACTSLTGSGKTDGNGETSDTRLGTLAGRFAASSHAELKRAVTEAIEAAVAPIRAEYMRVRADESYLRDVAEVGRMRAAEAAERTMSEVREVLGVGRL